MSALDKILSLSGQPVPSALESEDPAGELVLAALSGLAELRVLLASDADEDDDNDPDDDEDDDSSAKGDTDNDRGHLSHDTFKALKKRGMSDADAAKACAKADKKVKASALAEAAVVALSGLATPQGNWVELTAYDQRSHIALAGGSKEPYGDVEYADPGYQKDGKKRYPLDTEGHVRAAWSYINQEKNGGEYSTVQLTSIKAKIKTAARKRGIQISDDGEKVAATMVALAARQEIGVAMHHGPHTGRHAHGHMHTVVANEEHYHNNDSDHSRHGVGSAGDRDW